MSQIVTKWICDNCKDEYNKYVSFGYPDRDFDYQWKCKNCGYVNTLRVKALEYPTYGNIHEIKKEMIKDTIAPLIKPINIKY